MSNSGSRSSLRLIQSPVVLPGQSELVPGGEPATVAPLPPSEALPTAGGIRKPPEKDPLLTAEDVAERLNVTKDWVWDHSSRKAPLLPVIRMSDGTLRYRSSKIEEFIDERERLSNLRRKCR